MSSFANAEARGCFFDHAAYVLGNPRFDVEERERNLEIAECLRQLLTAGAGAEPLLSSLDALSPRLCHPTQTYDVTLAVQNDWLRAWAASDEPTLRRAMSEFLATGSDARTRLAHFVEAAEEVNASGSVKIDRGAALVWASLFNFAAAPFSLPVVQAMYFRQVEQSLGYEVRTDAALVEHYGTHLSFAAQLRRELHQAQIPVRDMLDVQSLIFLAAHQRDFWMRHPAGDWRKAVFHSLARPAKARRGRRKRPGEKPYLSVCACLGWDAPYLLEWVEFHRLVGVERFFLYNNGDREAQQQLLAPYVEDGIVVLHEWTVFPPQRPAFKHCIEEHREESRWIAFIDTDEFLFSPEGKPLPDVLEGYELWPGLGVNWALFGPSGHREKPFGLVIESYVVKLNRNRSPWQKGRPRPASSRLRFSANRLIKSIVDPTRTIDCLGMHHFLYRDGLAVDENHYPIRSGTTTFGSGFRLRVNHYFTRSEAEFRAKLARRRPDSAEPYEEYDIASLASHEAEFGEPDHAILMYVPELRSALDKAARRTATAGLVTHALPTEQGPEKELT